MNEQTNHQNVLASSAINTIDNLQKENKFPEAFIFAWGVIEFTLDMVILEEYQFPLDNMEKENPRAKVLLDLSFSRKLELQRKLKFLTNHDAKLVWNLQKKRNIFFHSWGFLVTTIPENEQREIIDLAKRVIEIIYGVVNKAFNPKRQKLKEKWGAL